MTTRTFVSAKGRNFYTDLMARMGFEEKAHRVQELFFAGRALYSYSSWRRSQNSGGSPSFLPMGARSNSP